MLETIKQTCPLFFLYKNKSGEQGYFIDEANENADDDICYNIFL